MQFATGDERIAFVAGFFLIVLALVLIIAGSATAGLIVALIGGIILILAIVKVQRRAPAVNDDTREPPTR
jgi:hypothetical protein